MKRNVGTSIATLLAGAVLCGAVLYAAPLDQLVPTIRNVRIDHVLSAIGIALVATVIRMFRIALLLPSEPPRIKLLGGMSLVTAASGLLPADVALFWGLRKYGGVNTFKACLRPWVGLRIYDLACLVLMLGIVVLSFPAMAKNWPLSPSLSLTMIILIGVAFYGVARRVSITSRGWVAFHMNRAGLFRQGDQAGILSRRSVVLAIVYWILLITSMVFLLLAFAPETSVINAIAAAMIVICVGTLPLQPPMSIGTAEAGWVFALTSIGISLENSATIAIGARLITSATLLAHVLVAMFCLPLDNVCVANRRRRNVG